MNPTTWLWIWIVSAVVFCVAEMFTQGLMLLPFGIGAGSAALCSILHWDVIVQLIVFVAVSLLVLFLLRPLARRVTKESPIKTGAERLVGQYGTVITELGNDSVIGMVRVEREEWRADASDGSRIPVGTKIIVHRIEGTRLIVDVVRTPATHQ